MMCVRYPPLPAIAHSGTARAKSPDHENVVRVVIVDDNIPLLEALGQLVERAGHDVMMFSGFLPAKKYLETARIDVLVTDVRLGAFNGLQLVMTAKKDYPETSAIVFSGFEDPVLRRDAAKMGAAFCLKPVAAEQLLHSIECRDTPGSWADRDSHGRAGR
jgi:DNA-binding NtrC family response regulator